MFHFPNALLKLLCNLIVVLRAVNVFGIIVVLFADLAHVPQCRQPLSLDFYLFPLLLLDLLIVAGLLHLDRREVLLSLLLALVVQVADNAVDLLGKVVNFCSDNRPELALASVDSLAVNMLFGLALFLEIVLHLLVQWYFLKPRANVHLIQLCLELSLHLDLVLFCEPLYHFLGTLLAYLQHPLLASLCLGHLLKLSFAHLHLDLPFSQCKTHLPPLVVHLVKAAHDRMLVVVKW